MSDLLNDMLPRPPADDRPRHAPAAKPQSKPRRGGPSIGFLQPGQIERWFVRLLYAVLALLVLLSVIGTFYGLRGEDAPIRAPLAFIAAVQASPGTLVLAIGVQVVLTLTQYGARQMARHDRRWWLLYLAALGVSVYYNYQAYWTPLGTVFPVYVAGVLIIAGDVLPEFLAVRHE